MYAAPCIYACVAVNVKGSSEGRNMHEPSETGMADRLQHSFMLYVERQAWQAGRLAPSV
jgi:hypothetical protein